MGTAMAALGLRATPPRRAPAPRPRTSRRFSEPGKPAGSKGGMTQKVHHQHLHCPVRWPPQGPLPPKSPHFGGGRGSRSEEFQESFFTSSDLARDGIGVERPSMHLRVTAPDWPAMDAALQGLPVRSIGQGSKTPAVLQNNLRRHQNR